MNTNAGLRTADIKLTYLWAFRPTDCIISWDC